MLKVFCGGSRIIPEYQSALPEDVCALLDYYMSINAALLIGDADGVDNLIQTYVNNAGYKNVVVFHSTARPRYMVNNAWQTRHVPAYGLKGREFMQAKDKAMAATCDEALMVWNPVSVNKYGNLTVSKGTLANCTNVVIQAKPVVVWSTAQHHAVRCASIQGLAQWMEDLKPYTAQGEQYKAMMIQEFQRQKNQSIRWINR